MTIISKLRFSFVLASVGISTILIIFLISFVGFALVSFKGLKNTNEKDFKTVETYKYISVNPHSNVTSLGVVEVPVGFLSENVLSYGKEDGNLILISNFGTEEYECSGKCYCEENRKNIRKNIGSRVLSSGVYVLIAAATSLFAISKAKSAFDSLCHEKLSISGTCLSNSVHSKVDVCTSVMEKRIYVQDKKKEIDETTKSNPEKAKKKLKKDIRKFLCHGNCIEKLFPNIETQEMATAFDCEKLHLKETVEVDCTDIENKAWCSARARRLFYKVALNPFCKESSRTMRKYYKKSRKKGNEEKLILNYEKMVSLCVGKGGVAVPGQGTNENFSVHCRQTHPKAKHSIKYRGEY